MNPMKTRVLAVDDDLAALKVLRLMLQALGCEVQSASSKDGARVACALTRFDVLITDVHLGGWHGLDLADECRKVNPALKVALVSTDRKHLDEARRAGYETCLKKPFEKAAIWNALGIGSAGEMPAPKTADAPGPVPLPAKSWLLAPVPRTPGEETFHVQPSPAC